MVFCLKQRRNKQKRVRQCSIFEKMLLSSTFWTLKLHYLLRHLMLLLLRMMIDVFFLIIVSQCDQIARFLKVVGDITSIKSSPNYWQLFGLFWKPHTFVKTYVATSWVTFENIWATFYSNIWSHWSVVKK